MIVGGKRGCGKTTELVKIAHQQRLYIICKDKDRVRVIVDKARELGLHIPFPIMVEELPIKGRYIREVLVDDIDEVLEKIIGVPILMSTTAKTLIPFKGVKKWKLKR